MAFKNILLIDDDEDDQEIFIMAVNRLDCGVVCEPMSDAKESLVRLKNGDIIPELIFLDLNMPGMNGRQFLEIIKNDDTLSHIPVIIFSTSNDPATIRETKSVGAKDFITKPGDFNHLINVLRPIFC
ncbi:MAG: response regulator [Flavobacterium sp.]|nr:MAG: response regulator [Flavobacterium sp.]